MTYSTVSGPRKVMWSVNVCGSATRNMQKKHGVSTIQSRQGRSTHSMWMPCRDAAVTESCFFCKKYWTTLSFPNTIITTQLADSPQHSRQQHWKSDTFSISMHFTTRKRNSIQITTRQQRIHGKITVGGVFTTGQRENNTP